MDETELDEEHDAVWPAKKPDPRTVTAVQLQQMGRAVLGKVVEYDSLLNSAIELSEAAEDQDDDHASWEDRQVLLEELTELMNDGASLSAVLEKFDSHDFEFDC